MKWSSEAMQRQHEHELFQRRTHFAMLERDAAERRAAENGLRNQRLAELTQALSGLNSDAWRGLDPARAAERVLPILESMVED